MYKIMQQRNGNFSSPIIDINYRQHNYSTRNSDEIALPFPRVDAIKFNYEYQFIQIWNSLPARIKQAPSLKTFKRLLTTHFLDSY